jgi:signal transduction histidine kinase/ABC-type nitrate/sulfonate/bicarbonate transport system substrate-binding protein
MICTTAYAEELKKIKIQLLWKNQFEFAGFYMAKELGYYRQAGFDVELIEHKDNINVVDEVTNNRAQFGLGYSSLILDIVNQKKDIKLISTIFQSSPMILLALKRDDIQNVKDIRGKRVMITQNQSQASILAMLQSEGIKNNDYKRLLHEANINALIDNKTDLMLAYSSNEPYLLREKGYDTISFSPKDYGFDFYDNILFTSKEYANKNPEIVDKIKKATIMGWKYAYKNIDKTIDTILKKYNTQNKSRASLLYEAQELKKLSFTHSGELGHIDTNRLQSIITAYRLLNLTDIKIFDFSQNIFHKVNNNSLNTKEKDYLKNKHSITMCVDPNWLPYEKIENSKHIGISGDYINLVSKKLNIPIELIPTTSWSQTLEYARSRKCDIISLAMATPSRKKYLNFTTPYLKTPLVIATKTDVNFIASIQSLNGKKLGVTKDFAYAELLRIKYPYIDIVEVKDSKDGLDRVNSGELYGFVGSLVSLGYHIQKEYLSEIKISGKFDSKYELSIAVRDDDLILLNILNKTVESISQSKIDEIMNKWISIKYDSVYDYSLIWKLVILFLAIVVVLFYSNYILKKRIKKAIKRYEEQKLRLIEKSKKAQLGEMISIISHQWKQPLSIIASAVSAQSVTYQIKGELNTQDVLKSLKTVEEQVAFMSHTIDDFRHFFNPDKQKEQIDLNQPIQIAIELMKSTFIKKDIEISTDINLPTPVLTYNNELIQVILNILKNATEQYDKSIENKQIEINAYEDTKYATIKIKDNAGGIPNDILPHIFEQYFTTKSREIGTGLGLDLCKTIIETNCSGELMAYNEDDGAVFIIRLPLAV